MIRRGKTPGLWVVASDFDPEPTPTASGDTETPTVGHAIALALTPESADAGLIMELQTQPVLCGSAPLRVAELADFLQGGATDSWCGAIDGIGRLTIRSGSAQVLRLAG